MIVKICYLKWSLLRELTFVQTYLIKSLCNIFLFILQKLQQSLQLLLSKFQRNRLTGPESISGNLHHFFGRSLRRNIFNDVNDILPSVALVWFNTNSRGIITFTFYSCHVPRKAVFTYRRFECNFMKSKPITNWIVEDRPMLTVNSVSDRGIS